MYGTVQRRIYDMKPIWKLIEYSPSDNGDWEPSGVRSKDRFVEEVVTYAPKCRGSKSLNYSVMSQLDKLFGDEDETD